MTSLFNKLIAFDWSGCFIGWGIISREIVSHQNSKSYKFKVTCPKNLDVRLRRCAGFHESQPGKELTSVSHSNLSPSPRSICLKHISKDIAKTIIKSWKRTDFNIISNLCDSLPSIGFKHISKRYCKNNCQNLEKTFLTLKSFLCPLSSKYFTILKGG